MNEYPDYESNDNVSVWVEETSVEATAEVERS